MYVGGRELGVVRDVGEENLAGLEMLLLEPLIALTYTHMKTLQTDF